MLLRINNFAGMSPSTNEKILPDNASTVAINCYFAGGTVGSWRKPSLIKSTVTPKKSIYKMGGKLSLGASDYDTKYWMSFDGDTDVVKGQVPDDDEERTYYTEFNTLPSINDYVGLKTDFLRFTTGGSPWALGVPTPSVAATPIATLETGGTPLSGAIPETRYYIYTYVTEWGEESQPSSPTTVDVTVLDGQWVKITNLVLPSATNVNIAGIRIYRTTTGTSATDWQLVNGADGEAKVAMDSGVFIDKLAASALYEVIPSKGYSSPPSGFQGLINLPNGITAGFKNNDVYFSEPLMPFTFPSSYRVTLDYKVVGLGVFGAAVVALTEGNPYIISGIDPAAMSTQKIEQQQACVSKRSIVSMGFGVLYASPDGIVLIDNAGATVVSAQHFTRRDWQVIRPHEITACHYEGRYYFWNSSDGYVFDLKSAFSKISTLATAVFNDIRSDSLFLASGTDIVKFDGDPALDTFTWRSKMFETPMQLNFSWCQVQIEDGAVDINIYADGRSIFDTPVTVSTDTPFRLPSGYKSKYWQVEISGTGTVRGINLAETMTEIQSV